MARTLTVPDLSDDDLLDSFVAAFMAFDDMLLVGDLGHGAALAVEELHESGLRQWRPQRSPTRPAALDALYSQLPYGLPSLFEALLLRWRWASVDLNVVELLANPAGGDLSGFSSEVLKDRGLAEVLLPAGYVQFGRVGGGHYDPVCFDLARGRSSDDARVVQIDHEEILCNRRLLVVREVQPSFRRLVEAVVASAAQSPGRAV